METEVKPAVKTFKVRVTPAARKAIRAYFAALWTLWWLWEVHGYELTGTLKDMEKTHTGRLRQSYITLARAIGGTSRRRDKDGKTLPSRSGLGIASGILEFATKRVFTKKFYEARRKRLGDRPIDWAKLPPEWGAFKVIAEEVKAIEEACKKLESWSGRPVAAGAVSADHSVESPKEPGP